MAAPETELTDHDSPPGEQQLRDTPRPQVLIVDDDLRTLRVFRRVLLQVDRHCVAVEHASQAFDVLRDHSSIEVVVGGIALIEQIRAHFGEQRTIQFILVSGQVSMQSAVSALRLEASDFLLKPVMPRDLLASVQQAMLKSPLGKAARARPLGPEPVTLAHRLAHYDQEHHSLRFLKRLYENRVRLFGETLLPDPAWGILAELMRAALTGRRVAVTALCVASKAPFTTALRRIDDLIEAGLAARMRDPSDRRRSYIELTDAGHQKMQRYLRNVSRARAR